MRLLHGRSCLADMAWDDAILAILQIVDNSSAYRMIEGVPLVIPEINPETVESIQLGKVRDTQHFVHSPSQLAELVYHDAVCVSSTLCTHSSNQEDAATSLSAGESKYLLNFDVTETLLCSTLQADSMSWRVPVVGIPGRHRCQPQLQHHHRAHGSCPAPSCCHCEAYGRLNLPGVRPEGMYRHKIAYTASA